MKVLFLTVIPALFFLAGCGRSSIVLHPTDKQIYFVPSGTEIMTTNHGRIMTTSDGLWMSEFYFRELFDAKVWEAQK